MKKLILLFSLISSTSYAQIGWSNGSTSGGTINNITGSGVPGGNASSIQFQVDPTTFGGSNWITSNSNVIQLRPTNYTTENGPFRFNIDSAAHDPGERRDDIFSMGWNQNGEATGHGSNALVFEGYCGPTVGCPLPGQSETYFSVNDGLGNSTRPIGIFQAFDGTGLTYGTMRFDTVGFWDRAQSYAILGITDNAGTGSITLGNSVISSTKTGAAFTIGGSNAVGKSGTVLQYGEGSANVDLSPGGDGSGIVRAASNHFRLSSGAIENSSGDNIFAASSDGPYLTNAGVNGDGLVYVSAAGAGTNIGLMLQPKAAGAVRLNSGSTGTVYFQTGSNQLLVGPFPGKTGVTVSGSACAITEITNGIITAATCTP